MSGPEIKTSVRLTGDEGDTFDCVRALLGKRRHELAADLVRAGMTDLLQDPDLAESVAAMVATRREYQAEQDARRAGRTKGGLTLLGGAS